MPDITIRPWQRPKAVEWQEPDREWLAWSLEGARVTADAPDDLLDLFCRLARPTDTRHLREHLEAVVDRWGPWGYCEDGDVHGPLEPDALGPSTTTDTAPVAAPEATAEAAPEGMAEQDAEPDAGPDGGVPTAMRRDWVPGLLVSAARINALRTVIARVSKGRMADRATWGILEPSLQHHGSAWDLGSPDAQAAALEAIVTAWMTAEHVRLQTDARTGRTTAAVGGVPGALAVLVHNELGSRRIGVCTNVLTDPDDRAGRLPCRLTWRVRRRRSDGSLPARCPLCVEAIRLKAHRRRPAPSLRARAQEALTDVASVRGMTPPG